MDTSTGDFTLPLHETTPPLSHEEKVHLFNPRLAKAGKVSMTREQLASWREGLPRALTEDRSRLDEGKLPERMSLRRVSRSIRRL